ncbi:NACHT domain-containing NTPase [Kibdelosporangium persicum]|uniref:NACHT domain-containing protein n=1 Tax=Kibdelosporangium persicum TaxID=2698649 RepID=A0ABX2F3B9_9PSEU|nr:hypothetical protein [Kibdelosporangium persicum]NRN65802.1 NACHT domain-containing protein [Kibdelosporangium persicum]
MIVVVVAAGLAGVVWMFTGRVAGDAAIGNAQVVGALAGVLAVLVAVVVLWPRGFRRVNAQQTENGHAEVAVEYLANETLRYWRREAKDRRITNPSPASVRWAWGSPDFAVPAAELQPDLPAVSGGLVLGSTGKVLTAGVVTELRQQLYECLDVTRGRIVVLGGPGAGKTSAMLLLLIDILEHRQAGSRVPIPVWLSLGGWNPDSISLEDWAAETLIRDYPALSASVHGGRAIAKELIRTGKVALFLDGLDEMAPAIQGRALQKVDRDAAGLKVVLTSRPREYHAAIRDGRLYGAAVVEVLPVDVDDAAAFLLAEQFGERRMAWQYVTDQLRDHPDSVAARTLRTPLALSLARETYTRADPAELFDTRAYPSPDTLLQHLLARSLILAYPDPAERARATRWLSWMARNMGARRDLLWWDILAWVPSWPTRLVFGLVAALPVCLTGGRGVLLGLVIGFVAAVVSGFELGPRTFVLRWLTYRELRDLLVSGVGPERAVELAAFWANPSATARAGSPLELYQSDLRRSLVLGLGTVLVLGLIGGLMADLAVGLALGFVAGLPSGLGPALQLTVVQMTWWSRGRGVRFLPLLNTAVHRQVLRQAGAAYQFRHACLQDYLATLDQPK